MTFRWCDHIIDNVNEKECWPTYVFYNFSLGIQYELIYEVTENWFPNALLLYGPLYNMYIEHV